MTQQRLANMAFAGLLIVMGIAITGRAEEESKPQKETAAPTETAAPQEPSATVAPAESEPQSQAAAPQASEPLAQPATPSSAAADGLISIDFKDADIRQVLRVISLKSGVDVVAGNDVEGLVTIKLTNVPWETALDIILRTYGFAYERKGKIVRVMTQDAVQQEALVTEVYPLDYAKSKEVPDVIQEMLSDRGKIKFDERTNTVIVTDISSNQYKIKEVIERIDRRTPQVLIETRVVETKLTKEENLGINWTDSIAATMKAATIPSTFPFPAGSSLGTLGQSFIPRAASVGDGRVPETGSTFTFGTLTSGGLEATMNFLQTRTDTHIVSNPTIAVLDNKEAKIHIGEEYPVPQYTLDATTGRTSISGYTPKETGTVLTVTPHVNPSDEIVVDLKPEVIAVGTDVTYSLGSGGSISFPRFTTQTAQTQVRIQNGQTIAIGGLVKTQEGKLEEKVPILGDLPILGALFKTTRTWSGGGTGDLNRQDLLIFLTVKLMDESKPGQTVAAAPKE